MTQNYADIRRDYTQSCLSESELTESPMALFERWFEEYKSREVSDPTAMVLSTVSSCGQPSQRIVLLKGVSEKGFRFYTNSSSNKGQEISSNPLVSLLFPWHDMERQVIVKGKAIRLPTEEAEAYFKSRPRQSQLGALASQQSQPIDSRQAIDEAYDALDREFPNVIPVPEHWCGFCVEPTAIEFWQGGARRLHDRLVYHRNEGNGWSTQRLMP